MIRVFIEKTARQHLTVLVQRAPSEFQLVKDPAQADVIIFENDEPAFIRGTAEYKNFRDKCIVVSEIDLPSYFLPACYAATDGSSWLSKNRTVTIPYLLSQISVANPFLSDINIDADRRYLYSFRGGATSWVRKRMLKLMSSSADTLIQDTNFYRHWNFDAGYEPEKRNHQKDYADILEQSSFVLCPRGAGVSSIRLFEVMRAGRVPVILADNWVPVPYIPWNEFAIFVPEDKISELDQIIRARSEDARTMGAKAREAWEKYCSPGADAALLAACIKQLLAQLKSSSESRVRTLYPIIEVWNGAKLKGRAAARSAILKVFSILGIKFPYSLNR